jgi:hypothetical protein
MVYGTVTRSVETREGAGEGAEISALPAPINISMTLLLASRFVAEIACVYTSSVIREFA